MQISAEIYNQLLTVRDWIRFGASLFNQYQLHFGHGTDNAWDEAALLVSYAIHLAPDSHAEILDAHLTMEEKKVVAELFQIRINQRLPAPYITKQAWFAGMKFYVDQHTLIPRSSLAEFIEKQLDHWIEPDTVCHVLDLCTGSGCIAVAAAMALPNGQIDAIDISETALNVARKNISMYELDNRIRVIASDLFNSLNNERYDIILSNPPYVSAAEMALLPAEYQHEPTLGLLAEDEGTKIVTQILQQANHFLQPDGLLIVEVGNSEQALVERFPHIPFTWLEFEHSEGGVFLLTKEQLQAAGEIS